METQVVTIWLNTSHLWWQMKKEKIAGSNGSEEQAENSESTEMQITQRGSHWLIIVVIIMWTSEKPSKKNNSDISVIWVSDWFEWVDLFKSQAWCHSFQPTKEHYLCFVVFCLLFSIIVYSQHWDPNWIRNLVLWINNYWKQQTDNNKTQIMFIHWLKTVTPCSKFCINISHFNKSETLKTVMSEFFFWWRFFTWPRNYYNDNKFKTSSQYDILNNLMHFVTTALNLAWLVYMEKL